MTAAKKPVVPKYPRVLVSPKRHTMLAANAKKAGVKIAALAESIFAKHFKK